MAKPDIKDFKKVLVVEGYSDLLFYAEVLEYLKKHGQVFIEALNGKEDLITQLEVLLTPELLAAKESIGVIIDADQDADAAARTLATTLKNATTLDLTNGIWSNNNPKIGFFIAPGNGQPGEVETLVWQAWSNVPANQHAKQCVDTYLNCMSEINFRAHSPDKGRIGTLLAVRADEDPRLGPGARQNVFDFSLPEFATLNSFLAQI